MPDNGPPPPPAREADALDPRFAASLPDIRSMGRMAFDPIWAEREHVNNTCELLHIRKGRAELHIRDRGVFTAGAGGTLFVPPRVSHRDAFDLDEGLELFYCAFSWEAAGPFFAAVPLDAALDLPPHRLHEIGLLVDQLQGDLAGESPADRLLARTRLQTLLLLVLREVTTQNVPPPAEEELTYGAKRRRDLMRRAKAYLEAHYAECVALEDIARALHVSAYHLSHVFSEESDFSLFRYLTALRMEKAKALLQEPDRTVGEVAVAVGYETANYFSKVFRKHCGCAPSEYALGGGANGRGG